MNGGNNILPTMSAYGREMDHHHYNGLSSSGNSNVITGYPILYQNNHNHPAGDLLTLQMQLQGNSSNNENENTLAALQRNWIALQQNNGGVNGNGTGGNNGMLHSSIHHPITIPNEDMSYMRNLIPIGGSNSSPLHSNQSTLLDSLKFGGGLEPPNQVTQYGGHHHHLTSSNIQPSILDNNILGNNVGISGVNRNNPMNVTTSPNGRLQMQMNPNNNGLGVNVDMVSNNGMLSMNCSSSINGNVIVNNNNNSNNIEWQGGIPIRNIPDLMTMLDLSDIPPHVQIPKYYEGIKISLGEAGREILRCYINQRGIRGKFMSSSNLQQLLRVAHQCGLWNAAVRLHLEFIGEIPMTASHAEMRKYKSLQTKRRLSKRISVLSKFGAPVVRRADGEETIEYRDGMKLSLGVDGRKLLLKRIRETRSSRENEINNLFSKYGLKYSQLRNATIHELCRMAYVCGLWEEAVKLHFQHIRKKAHENTTNQQESGSDLDSEMDINKEREDDIISNNFLQQLHNPGIDMLNVNNGNNSNINGSNGNNIAQSSVIGSIGSDPVHLNNNNNHVHQHPVVSHIQSNISRFGISGVGNSVTNSNSKNNDGNNLSTNNPIMNITDNGGIHPSLVISSNNNAGSANHALTSDHLNYDDYRNYILDNGGNNIDNANLTSVRTGGMNSINNIVGHESRNNNNNNNVSNGGNIGNSNDIINKVLGNNSNTSTSNLNDLNNNIMGLENEGILGITTGALGAFVGNSSSSNAGGNIPNYDGIAVANNNYDDYSLLSASIRKRSKTTNVDENNNNTVVNNRMSSNVVAHPNTSSFVMETISGILGDETIGNNMVNEKINYKSNNLSSVLGNDVNICQNNDVPQLSAVVVLAAAKAAEAAQNYDKSKSENDNGKKVAETDSPLKNSLIDEKHELNSNLKGENKIKNEDRNQNQDTRENDNDNSSTGVTSYVRDYSNKIGVPLESNILLNEDEQILVNTINSKLLPNTVEVNKNYDLINDHLDNDNADVITASSASIERGNQFCFPPSSNQISHKSTDNENNGLDDMEGNRSNVEGISLVARGLTTQSTTDTSIESAGN